MAAIVLGRRPDFSMVEASALNVQGAQTLLLKDALAPNLVQTLEGGPAFVHGGPFANIAHGCNSLIATSAALRLGDIVVTEAGFGSELGAEKFFDIKCRVGGLKPAAAVVVATIRSLKMQGGVPKNELSQPDPEAVCAGFPNLHHHIDNVKQFGVPVIVAINRFSSDTDEEVAAVVDMCRDIGTAAVPATIWADGGAGGEELAEKLLDVLENEPSNFKPVYRLEESLESKLKTIATKVYGADGVELVGKAQKEAQRLEEAGYGSLPVCVAKTQYSLTDNPALLGRPRGFKITVRELRLSAGAGFVVALTGDVMTMPGLPARPAAEGMKILRDGTIEGLF
jgi:formate--tetrahydrofolate ligase